MEFLWDIEKKRLQFELKCVKFICIVILICKCCFVVEGDMKKLAKLIVLLSVVIFSSSVFAIPNAWLNTNYYSSSYRSPVTGGYMDILVFVDNVTFTDLNFSIIYDANIVEQIGTGNVNDVISGLTVSEVTTVDIEGSW